MGEFFEKDQLSIDIKDDPETVYINMHGISRDREPGSFIIPVLAEWVDRAIEHQKKIIFNMGDLQYLNASSITAIAKVFRRSKERQARITMEYAANKRWQELIFSSFRLFETKNKTIRIEGK